MEVDLKTTHNIQLQFAVAHVAQRIGAFVIDFIIVSIYGSITMMSMSFAGEILPALLVIPAYFAYNLCFELYNNGQTPGKMVTKVRVISMDGKNISTRQAFVRWAFRLVDIGICSGIVAVLAILSSDKSQRIGDLLANTLVISLSGNQASLKSIIDLDNLDYEVTYPEVVMYKDDDMLMVKELLKRVKSVPSPQNKDLVNTVANRIKTDLGLDENLKLKSDQFLNTVVRDYIMCTR